MSTTAESADLLRLLHVVEQLHVPSYVLNLDGRVIGWNRACEALTGLPAAQVLGTDQHWRAFSVERKAGLADLLLLLRGDPAQAQTSPNSDELSGTQGLHTEQWYEMPLRGNPLYLKRGASEIRDAQGRILGVLETLHDLSGHERASERFRRLFESTPDPVWIIENNCFVDCNDAAVAMLGYQTRGELLNTHPSQLSPSHQPNGEGSFEKAERMMAIATETGLHRFEWVHRRLDGSVFDAEVTLSRIEMGGQHTIYCTWRDISGRKKAEEALRLYATVFERSGEAILITDANNLIVAVNQSMTELSGFGFDELRGRNPRIFDSGQTPKETHQAMWAALNEVGYWQGELWGRRKDGSLYTKWAAITACRDDEGHVTNYIASYTDISSRKAAEARIDYLAHHDALTGLLNRYSLESQLKQALSTARREGDELAVMFIDMDRFKLINDTLGHDVGDRLLVEVAARLRASVRENDIVARLGGDEFVVALVGLEKSTDAIIVAQHLQQALAAPYVLGGKTLHSTPSMGISLFPGDASDAEGLMKQADAAMYQAKAEGRNNFQFFTAEMTERAIERMDLERDLRHALAQGQFELHYQPQVRAVDGSLCGMEALLRWRHPVQGLMAPLKFIPVAEESGLIEPLGAWVLDEACRQLAEWHAQGLGPPTVSVNVSVHQLRSHTLVDTVRSALQRHQLAGDCLELEVTETSAMEHPEQAIAQLKLLRGLGVNLAIDDFGTGYSSLAYLKLLPIQTLKLDRAFVRDIETDENDAAISAAALALAATLGLKVVAEGVETEGQRNFLIAHHCDVLQGYLFGKPAAAAFWIAHWFKNITK